MHYPHTHTNTLHYTPLILLLPQKRKMVSLDTPQAISKPLPTADVEPNSSPRISFSSEFLDENNFISICPNPRAEKQQENDKQKASSRNAADFDFQSNNLPTTHNPMLSADELIFEGKLLPFWQQHYAEKLNKINLKVEEGEGVKVEEISKEEISRPVNWFIDEDPSPRPPNCTVLWKELLRLKKKQRASSSLSPSSSTSSSSSSSGSNDLAAIDEGKEGSEHKEKVMKRIKKGLERTRSASLRIRPVVNVPICTQMRSSANLPPLFRKVRLDR